MATLAGRLFSTERLPDVLSGTPRAHTIDRWIFVVTAGWFIMIVATGFVPDSIMKIGMVEAGKRPPFPLIMHIHAILMGSFLLLTFAQTWLMATGRNEYHVRLGGAAFVLAPALVVAGFILAPTMYHETWSLLRSAPPEARAKLQVLIAKKEDILLVQLRIGLLFPLFLVMGLRARGVNAGLHKRMMLLAPAVALTAGIDRITWLPTTMPGSYLSIDAFMLAAIAPMFLWDVIRNRRVHEAYWIWIAVILPVSLVVYRLWDTPWWHVAARQILGVPT